MTCMRTDSLQRLRTGLAHFEVVHWTVLNFDNCIVDHSFLGFKIFCIIFLKLFELYFRATWAKLSGLSNFFPNSLPLTCIKAPNSLKSPPKVGCMENLFSPAAHTALFIFCLQKCQIFLLFVAPQPCR